MIYEGALLKTSIDDLRERITVQTPILERDEEGNIVEEDYKDVKTMWAKVYTYAPRRQDGTVEVTNELSHRVTIRYTEDIAYTDRIVWRGKILKIARPPFDAEGRRKWLVIDCVELLEVSADA